MNYYAAPDGLPFNVHVILFWGGREFVGARVRHPKTEAPMWVSISKRGDMTPIHIDDGIILWRPQRPDLWKLPLPSPVTPTGDGRMFSTTTKFQVVDEAEAAELAREMESDRLHMRNVSDRMRNDPAEAVQWWRDVSRIKYQPHGEVTVDMAEARVMRALILDRHMRGDMRRIKTNGAVLADLKRSLLDILEEAPLDDWVPPLTPLAEDHRDYMTVMEWITEYECTWREAAALRRRSQGPPASWRQIGDEIGRSPQGSKNLYHRACVALTATANQPLVKSRERLLSLQERNRAWKRQAV